MRLLDPLLRWLGSRGAWIRSRYSDLPRLDASAATPVSHYCVIAGGLALILSRCHEGELANKFLATQELRELLRRQLRRYGRAKPSAELLSDVMHEVATLADPTTRAALRACLELRSKIEARRRDQGTATSSLPDSLIAQGQTYSPQVSVRSTRQDSLQEAHTLVSGEVFDGRAEALRAAVASAKDRVPAPARDTSPV